MHNSEKTTALALSESGTGELLGVKIQFPQVTHFVSQSTSSVREKDATAVTAVKWQCVTSLPTV